MLNIIYRVIIMGSELCKHRQDQQVLETVIVSQKNINPAEQIYSCPTTNIHVEEKIKDLSKFKYSNQKIYKLGSPYNIVFCNEDLNASVQKPAGYTKIYKLKQNQEFQGYFEGTVSNDGKVDLKDTLYVYSNASYLIGSSQKKGIYKNQVTSLSYDGEWQNLQPHGVGTQKNNKGTYEGTFFEGKKHGKGKFTWNNGAVYDGQFDSGYLTGKGILKVSQNQFYRGQFAFDMKNGRGYQEWKNIVYEGQFFKGKRSGYGRLTIYKDESKKQIKKEYKGQFQEGFPSGNGRLQQFSDPQKIIEGIWLNGKLISISQ